MKEVEISRRSAFRYINTISHVGVPIYYDRELGKYLLNEPGRGRWGVLTVSEKHLLTCVLAGAMSQLNTDYSRHLTRIMDKIPVSGDFRQISKRIMKTAFSDLSPKESLIDRFHGCQIAVAIESGFSISVGFFDGKEKKVRRISKPSLLYDGVWILRDELAPHHEKIPCEWITSVLVGE